MRKHHKLQSINPLVVSEFHSHHSFSQNSNALTAAFDYKFHSIVMCLSQCCNETLGLAIRWPTFSQEEWSSELSIDLILLESESFFFSFSVQFDFVRWFVVCFRSARAFYAVWLEFLWTYFFLMIKRGAHKLPFEPHLRQRKVLSKKTMAITNTMWRRMEEICVRVQTADTIKRICSAFNRKSAEIISHNFASIFVG